MQSHSFNSFHLDIFIKLLKSIIISITKSDSFIFVDIDSIFWNSVIFQKGV